MQEALRSLKAKLSLYKDIPENGLALFCGSYTDAEGKERRVVADIQPLRLLPHSLYKCDSRFHTELLREQLADDSHYGFIIIDGSCASFHLLVGDTKQTIFKKEVQLPKKHGRGGQSQNRFARIREEKRDWYTSDIAECANKHFISLETNKVNVKALIVAGSANLKNELIKKLDPRIQRSVLHTYDIQYNGEAGFNQTLTLCEADLLDCRYTFEKNLLSKFFNAISADDKLYCFSPSDTVYALEAGAVDTLIVWNELPVVRYEMFQPSTSTTKIVFKSTEGPPEMKAAGTESYDSHASSGDDAENLDTHWEVKSSEPLLDWILEHYKEFGSDVQLVSGSSSLGAQFVQGFGGFGALLRYTCEVPSEIDVCGAVDSDEDEYEW